MCGRRIHSKVPAIYGAAGGRSMSQNQKMIERIAKRKTLRPLAMLAAVLLFAFAWLLATEKRGSAATGTGDYISGAVTSSKGAEAGVWVVAETTDLPTKYVKIVVTDDRGRYVLPQLPMATYQVFVRGYGLVDSPRVPAKPGQHLDLKAVVAPDARAAAQYYPGQLLVQPRQNTERQALPGRFYRQGKILPDVPSNRRSRHARDSRNHQGSRPVSQQPGSLGSSHEIRPSRRGHERLLHGTRGAAHHVRRLE